jgi:hypothetical protein
LNERELAAARQRNQAKGMPRHGRAEATYLWT